MEVLKFTHIHKTHTHTHTICMHLHTRSLFFIFYFCKQGSAIWFHNGNGGLCMCVMGDTHFNYTTIVGFRVHLSFHNSLQAKCEWVSYLQPLALLSLCPQHSIDKCPNLLVLSKTHTNTHTGKPCQSRTMIFDSLNEDVRVLWDTLCVKLRTHNLCMTFQLWTEDQTLRTLFSLFFFNIPLYARVGSRQFATVCTYPQIVDRPCLQCCPRSECGVSEYVLGWQWLQLTHTHTHTHTHKHTLVIAHCWTRFKVLSLNW